MIKILAPLNKVSETEPLITAGANEIYCGVYHKEWYTVSSGKPNVSSTSDASLQTFSQLSEVVEKAHKKNVVVYFCLNSIFCWQKSLVIARNDIREAIRCGVDGVVLRDPALIEWTRSKHPEIYIIVSTLANCFNSETIRYFKKIGANRIVLPEYMTIHDMELLHRGLVKKDIEIDLEVFILNIGCRNNGGFCRMHGVMAAPGVTRMKCDKVVRKILNMTEKIIPTIHAQYVKPFYNRVLQAQGYNLNPCMMKYDAHFINLKTGNQEKISSLRLGEDYANICGVCAMALYEDLGIQYIKIVGREFPLATKVKDVTFLSLMRDSLNKRISDIDAFIQLGQRCYKKIYGRQCAHDECQYPSFIEKRKKVRDTHDSRP